MIPGNRVSLLHDGGETLPAMLDAIAQARREILLEMYWFGSDRTGRRFAEALEEKARQGVRVLVTYDAAGSFEADRGMFEQMCEAGCGVYEFNPVHFWRPRFRLSFAGLNQRNHRKMLIVDGVTGFTGGLNLADPWAPEEAGGDGFRDDMIRVDGPAVESMRSIFLGCYRGDGLEAALADDLPATAGEGGNSRVRVLANDLRQHRKTIERAYLARIRMARERLLITNSYFIPSFRVRRHLARAVERGVRVKVLLPVESDVPAVTYATRRLYSWMMRRGIELYEWPQSILHSKTAVVDGHWCTVGTHNIDYRSWAYNLEINVAVEDAEVAGRLEARMEEDIAGSVRVDPHNWRFRSLGQRVLEQFFYRFRRLM